MKNIVVIAALCAALVVSCQLAEETGRAYIRIGGIGGARTAVPDAAELAGISYQVTLFGPGGPIVQNFGPEGGIVAIAQGQWRIMVKASNAEPRLRGLADETVQVRSGETRTIMLKAAIGIRSGPELEDVLTASDTNSTGLAGYLDTDLSRDNLLILENDITLDAMITTPGGRKFTLIADPETTRTITRSLVNPAQITVASGDTMNLGRAGESGKLVFDGAGDNPNNISLFYAAGGTASDAALIIDGNTEITNCRNLTNRGAVVWTSNARLELRGGKIYNNHAGYAGAIEVGEGSVFVMSGGEISGNKALGDGSQPGNGGGVYVEQGCFEMSGGRISGNTAADSGGGVYVDDIRYLDPTNVYGYVPGEFVKTGGTIENNTAEADKGGHQIFALEGYHYRDTAAGPQVNLSSDGWTANWSIGIPGIDFTWEP